ncbi:alpha/beta hydrolase-fold protein [Marivirga salinae]|uniref:Alpha/beta hydrolase-fold protein n=1 Tax=Marivirga salinarum TaxID=3059078 RepID=A0AA49JBY7_9BACT|nr:alpha/beta hydrolase-fold protein [Marivirga sp. BDSF4-3]WKK77880.2 alpha/beta hydrolase-fold protein [Marivirga sp. BDSF4-3]
MRSQLFILFLFFSINYKSFAQTDSSIFNFTKHKIDSKFLQENREYWVSLPLNYSETVNYNVMYVFDAEWRFDLIRNIEFDFSANQKIEKHIIVGIPHMNIDYKRNYDLSFSQSRTEYDGESVDSTWYNSSNSGGGHNFYNYLTQELIPSIDSIYATNGNNTLVGHSMGGYFGAYILSMNHPFSTLHLYDPSIWYSNGEAVEVIKNGIKKDGAVNILITYQPKPSFHKQKIEALIDELKKIESINLNYYLYEKETHNSLFLPSFMKGINLLMENKQE